MPTYNGKPFSSTNNLNLKKGILRFGATQTSNPVGSSDYGLYVNSSGSLIFSAAGSSTTLGAAGSPGTIPSWDAIFQGDQTLNLVALSSFTIDRSSGNNDVLTITNSGAGSGDLIQITNVGTGNDIEGTNDTWHFNKTGDMTANTVVFAGDAGSNSITLTAGDMVLSDGSIAVTDADDAASLSVTNDTATSASVFVFAGSGAFTGSTTSSFFTITPSGLTSGTAVYIPLAALTTGIGFQVVGDALTSGQLIKVSSSGAGTQITGNGRLFLSDHSGNAAGSAVLNEFASAAADETTIVKMTASAALAAGAILKVSGSSMTTGTAVQASDLDALTTGIGVHVASTSTGLTSGSLLRVSTATTGAVATNGVVSVRATGAYTSTSNVGLVDVLASGTTAGTVVRIAASAAGQTATELLRVVATGYTTGYTGNVANFIGCSTTGASNVVAISSANSTAGTALSVTANSLTTGSAVLVTSSGTITSAGEGLVNIVGSGITSGSALKIDLTEATLNGGYYLNCYDDTGAGAVFTIGEDGAVVIAGGSLDAITVTAGHLVLTSGNATLTSGNLVLTSGNATLTSGNLTITAGNATLTDGDLTLSEGKLAITDTADERAASITGNVTAATNPVVLIKQDHLTGAVAALELSQDDDDVEFLKLTGTSGSGKSIDSDDKSAGTAVYIKIKIGSTAYWVKATPGA